MRDLVLNTNTKVDLKTEGNSNLIVGKVRR